MSGEGPPEGFLGLLRECVQQLDHEGFWQWRTSWSALQRGARPNEVDGDPGEWQHGWQCWSSGIKGRGIMLLGRIVARQAHLRGHSGTNAGLALAHCPTAPEFTLPPHLFRTLLLERLRLPLQFMEATCEGCQALLDMMGLHRGSCTRSGRVKRCAGPVERRTARVFREAGACVRQNVFLRDMNVNVPSRDSRHIEVLAQNLPCFGGVQLAADITLRSSLAMEKLTHTLPSMTGCLGTGASRQGEGVPGTRFFWLVQARGACD